MIIRKRITASSIATRIDSVKRRHRRLKELVAAEQRKRLPDEWVLKTLKRERLEMKDVLTQYEGLLRTLSRRAINAS
ncbi:MAG: DUF465 domain-containing protein [Pseudomonadota bacterium]